MGKTIHLKFIIPLIIAFFLLALNSCRPTRNIPENSYYLKENIVKTDIPNFDTYSLNSLAKPATNRKFFDIIKLKVRVYSMFNGGHSRRYKNWIKTNFGEPPVLLDTNFAIYSASQMKLYMMNNGYFNAKVEPKIMYSKKTAKVEYHITCGEPYQLISKSYQIEDKEIESIVFADSSNTLLKHHINFSTALLSAERDRIISNLRNSGYYNFAREFISYQIDTNNISNALPDRKSGFTLKLIISNPIDKDSVIIPHKRYKIRSVNLFTEYNPLNTNQEYEKNITIQTREFGDTVYIPYTIFYHDKLAYRPHVLSNSVIIKQGDWYSLRNSNLTFNRFNDLRNFGYINILHNVVVDSINHNQPLLDCNIFLHPLKKHEFSIETKGTNSGGNLGAGLDIFYYNRNVFKRAQIFSTRIGGAFEAQKVIGDANQNQKTLFIFNTLEISSNIKLEIPSFIFPIRTSLNKKLFRPKTIFQVGANYQQRPDYTRLVGNISFGYEWRQSREIRHLLYPIDINTVKINPDSSFLAVLNQFNRRIREQYTDHLVFALKYSLIYSNQLKKEQINYSFLRFNIESVGNALNMYNALIKSEKNTSNQYLLFGIPYANYVSADIDFRHYIKVTDESVLALRSNFGFGIPLLNSWSIPFEKSYFLGGANSMRGWRMRTLGPGSYQSDNNFERTGDLKMELNAEMRFPIWSYFKGAFFADAGNVWLMRENLTVPNGNFQTNRFYKEIAFDAGVGIRLDFDFFIVRFDGAFKLYDPEKNELERWRIKELSLKDFVINFAIGYPF